MGSAIIIQEYACLFDILISFLLPTFTFKRGILDHKVVLPDFLIKNAIFTFNHVSVYMSMYGFVHLSASGRKGQW